MRQGCVPTLLLLLLVLVLVPFLTHTGEITVSYARDGVAITCSLRGSDGVRVTQVNWFVRHRGSSNQTLLGAFHPDHGAYVPPERRGGAEIQANVPERSFTLRLKGGSVGDEGGKLCCIFNAFPIGVFERCKDTSTAAAQEAYSGVESQVQGAEQWALVIGGFLMLFLSIITMVFYLCKWCRKLRCRRRIEFKVQTHLTDQRSNSEEGLEEPPQASLPEQPPPLPAAPPEGQGFSPAKLYAKIKLDLLYGRLWKTYQGTSRAWTPNPPPGDPLQAHAPPHRVYSLLGEVRPAAQEVEAGSVSPDLQPHPQVTPAEERSEVNPDLVTPVDEGSRETAAHPEDSPEEDCKGDVTPI